MEKGGATEQRVGFGRALALCAQAGRGPLFTLAGFAVLQALLPVAGLFAMQELVDAVARGVSRMIPAEQAWSLSLIHI